MRNKRNTDTPPALTAIRLSPEDRARVARLAALLTERASGAGVTASEALRVALRRGLDAFEAERGRR